MKWSRGLLCPLCNAPMRYTDSEPDALLRRYVHTSCADRRLQILPLSPVPGPRRAPRKVKKPPSKLEALKRQHALYKKIRERQLP